MKSEIFSHCEQNSAHYVGDKSRLRRFMSFLTFRSKVEEKGKNFEKFFEYAVEYRTSWIKRGFDTPILNKIIFKKIQKSFGGQLKVIVF